MLCLSSPCSLSPSHLTGAGSSWPQSLPAALADAQGDAAACELSRVRTWGLRGPGTGDSGAWDAQGHSRVYPSSVAFLCPQHEALLSVLLPCTMCQTRPAELPVKCMDLCHFWATPALSSQVCHWYALSLQKGVLNRLEFKHKIVSGLIFTQKLFPLITLHR